jgi:hypothetical protein
LCTSKGATIVDVHVAAQPRHSRGGTSTRHNFISARASEKKQKYKDWLEQNPEWHFTIFTVTTFGSPSKELKSDLEDNWKNVGCDPQFLRDLLLNVMVATVNGNHMILSLARTRRVE